MTRVKRHLMIDAITRRHRDICKSSSNLLPALLQDSELYVTFRVECRVRMVGESVDRPSALAAARATSYLGAAVERAVRPGFRVFT